MKMDCFYLDEQKFFSLLDLEIIKKIVTESELKNFVDITKFSSKMGPNVTAVLNTSG